MRYRLSFGAGFALGFVVGARAGRERYEQMKQVARRVMDNPTVQQAAGALQAQAGDLAQTARQRVGGKLHEKLNGRRSTPADTGEPYVPATGMQDGSGTAH